MTTSDRVRAARAARAAGGDPDTVLQAFWQGEEPAISAQTPPLSPVNNSDHGAVIADRDLLLEAYRALLYWTGYQLVNLAPQDLHNVINALSFYLPKATVDDVLWSLHDARRELAEWREAAVEVTA